jgi:hypothetical protein
MYANVLTNMTRIYSAKLYFGTDGCFSVAVEVEGPVPSRNCFVIHGYGIRGAR